MTESQTFVKTIKSTHLDTKIKVCGWLKYFRKQSSKLAFAKLSDGTCHTLLQLVFTTPEWDIFTRGKIDISVTATGTLVKSPASGQEWELIVESYTIHGDIMEPDKYPMQKLPPSREYRRTLIPHLSMRTQESMAIARVKSELVYGMSKFFRREHFTQVQIPLITDNECESGANPFTVTTLDLKKSHASFDDDFFKKHVYLTVSGQLHLEALVLGALSRAWCMTTAFRAEPSTGPRHLAEFWMAELEFCFSTLNDNMRVNEACIQACFKHVLKHCRDELEFFQKERPGLVDMITRYASEPFVRSSHEECVRQMLADINTGKVKIDPSKKPDGDLYTFKDMPSLEDDLSKDHERYITEVIHGGKPVFCRFFPAKIKSFYMPKVDVGAKVEHVDGFDLLFPEIGEIVGGSQRESDYAKLMTRMEEMQVSPQPLEFYSELRKAGTVPHGGSGIGMDRLMMVLTGIFNAKDMIPFPRAYQTCKF